MQPKQIAAGIGLGWIQHAAACGERVIHGLWMKFEGFLASPNVFMRSPSPNPLSRPPWGALLPIRYRLEHVPATWGGLFPQTFMHLKRLPLSLAMPTATVGDQPPSACPAGCRWNVAALARSAPVGLPLAPAASAGFVPQHWR